MHADSALQEEVERLQVELSAKTITIHSQADEISSLYAEIDKLRVYDHALSLSVVAHGTDERTDSSLCAARLWLYRMC